MTTGPRWVAKQAVLLLHAEGLDAFGGVPGVRDGGLLERALARPLNLSADEGVTGPCRLAASHAGGLLRNPRFVDGNKRFAFAAAGIFLHPNRFDLAAPQAVATAAILERAAGDLPEDVFAARLRDHVTPGPAQP